jgi:hypothetical protein
MSKGSKRRPADDLEGYEDFEKEWDRIFNKKPPQHDIKRKVPKGWDWVEPEEEHLSWEDVSHDHWT